MPMPPALAIWVPICSASIDFQMPPALPLPYTVSDFSGIIASTNCCITSPSNFL